MKKKKDKEKKEKEKRPKYKPVGGLLGAACDYHIYRMGPADRLIAAALGMAAAVVVLYVFFHSVLLGVLAGLCLIVPAQKLYREYQRKKRQKNLLIQFKDLLESLSSSYSAGQNTLAAFTDARADMVSIYGETADIVAEIDLIVNGMANNFAVEQLLENFAARSGLEDIESFANVFEVANRQGSNLKQVIADSREIINDKIEIEMEIQTMLTGNKNELNIMLVMPLVILLSLNGMGGMTASANTPENVLVKLFCLALFAVAYWLGRKIVDIRL